MPKLVIFPNCQELVRVSVHKCIPIYPQILLIITSSELALAIIIADLLAQLVKGQSTIVS